MKLYKAGFILQMIYCGCCLPVAICMPLYTMFYGTDFGEFCFRAGALLTVVSMLNPIGLAGTVMNMIGCYSTDLKKSKRYYIWTGISPVVMICSWLLAVCFFVHHSGGV